VDHVLRELEDALPARVWDGGFEHQWANAIQGEPASPDRLHRAFTFSRCLATKSPRS
jgi:hypothetical protein